MQHAALQSLLHGAQRAVIVAVCLLRAETGLLRLAGPAVRVHHQVGQTLQEALLRLGDRAGGSSGIEAGLVVE